MRCDAPRSADRAEFVPEAPAPRHMLFPKSSVIGKYMMAFDGLSDPSGRSDRAAAIRWERLSPERSCFRVSPRLSVSAG
jgi:hypothetical protein